jgi:ABC-type methionine transport system ATPase subunit
MIDLVRVTKQFDGKRNVTALSELTLSIARGELVAIIGPSGSGKSTLLNLIGGLDRPTSGDIHVDGEALGGLSDDGLTRVRRDKIGFIFQFFNLLPTLSCLENVGLPLHLRGWSRAKVHERATDLLRLVQLSHRIGHLPEELSGGERQRVAIARALVSNPQLLICDEVTSALDVSVQAAIVDLLAELQRELGLGLLFVTHNLALIRTIAQEVVVMSGGRIVERGPSDTVLFAPQEDYTKRLLADTPSLEAAMAASG